MAPMDLYIEFWGLPRWTSLNMILNWEKVATVFFFHASEQDHAAMTGGHDGDDAHQLMPTLVACHIRNDE